MGKDPSQVYRNDFFASFVDGAARSASVIVPLVLSLGPIKSVVDVGCGVGAWAAEFLAQGIPDVLGIDGDYVDRSQLQIPPDRFFTRDLRDALQLDRTFDLAVCLEVAEHLPESRAQSLVADLTRLAPCVLFSAAIPRQGGARHINEQYLPYWDRMFQRRGFEGIDPIRPRVLGNASVEWWYQQNTVMFAAPNHPLLTKGFSKPQSIIHQTLYEDLYNRLTLGTLVRVLPAAVRRSIRFHLSLAPADHRRG